MPSSKSNITFGYDTYLSAFTTRYGSDAMRQIWSEENKRLLWRQIWVVLARAQHKAGLLNKKELDDIVLHAKHITIAKSKKREQTVYHELMSEIQIFSEACRVGGGKIHLGATSADILDSATILQIKASLRLTQENIKKILAAFVEKIETYQDIVCMGYTHLQPAEPTTLGYRFAFYAQDLLNTYYFLEKIEPFIQTKGMKGAVGTSASYAHLLIKTQMTPEMLEKEVMQELGLEAVAISHQTYPRSIDAFVIEGLANVASAIHKFCFDFRIMQSANFNEWMEKRDTKRVGSSAMPFKRNPDRAEKVCSLCRYIINMVPLALQNSANSLLERTLDDSATQRIFLPDTFLALDDCLHNMQVLLENFAINRAGIEKNLQSFGAFAGTEPLLMELTKRGANRQKMHELIKACSMQAWEQREQHVSLFALLAQEKRITRYISQKELEGFSNPKTHIGIVRRQTKRFLKQLRRI